MAMAYHEINVPPRYPFTRQRGEFTRILHVIIVSRPLRVFRSVSATPHQSAVFPANKLLLCRDLRGLVTLSRTKMVGTWSSIAYYFLCSTHLHPSCVGDIQCICPEAWVQVVAIPGLLMFSVLCHVRYMHQNSENTIHC